MNPGYTYRLDVTRKIGGVSVFVCLVCVFQDVLQRARGFRRRGVSKVSGHQSREGKSERAHVCNE